MASYPFARNVKRNIRIQLNRRHHAQPIACPECGPQVKIFTIDGIEINSKDPIELAASLLKQGTIVAIKGIGGYHLCCDATNAEAVRLLRERKGRPVKPLAMMSSSLQAVKGFA